MWITFNEFLRFSVLFNSRRNCLSMIYDLQGRTEIVFVVQIQAGQKI